MLIVIDTYIPGSLQEEDGERPDLRYNREARILRIIGNHLERK
jgi:hypothetical protein